MEKPSVALFPQIFKIYVFSKPQMINLQESEAEQPSGGVPRDVKGVVQVGC